MKKTVQRYLNDEEAERFGFALNKKQVGNNKARYRMSPKKWRAIEEYKTTPNERKFVETIRKLDKNEQVISTVEKFQSEPIDVPDHFEIIKVSTSKTTGQQWVQYAAPKPEELDPAELDIEGIVQKYIGPVKRKKVKQLKSPKDFDRLIITDVHVGMDTNKYDQSMYAIDWDRKALMESADTVIETTIEEKESDLLILDDYGDLLDGFDGKTTRGGHDLPQNMTNEEAFDAALAFKMKLVEELIGSYTEIRVNNICCDNHSGAMGYFVNEAMKQVLEAKYDNVTVTNHRKFINHYYVGDICFAITHGKDDKALKFGFKPHLKPDAIEKIDQYLKHNKIYRKSELVIFCKGDSHQALFDMCSSDDFYYFNYPALSPSSQWVQTNFKKGRRGFFLESFRGTKIYMKPNFIK